MFRTLDDFFTVHAHLTDGTGKLLHNLTDTSLDQAVAPGHRALGGLAWHLVVTVPEMMQRTGLPLSPLNPETPPPSTAAEISRVHAEVNKELAESMRANWTDADLATEDDMYGERWSRGRTLAILVDHEIHHRGQITVLMRQAGLAVPGLFGPSRDEWTRYGMKPPAY